MKPTDRRTGGYRMCKCGRQQMYHRSEPAYFGGERFSTFSSSAQRDGCKGFNEDPDVTDFTHVFKHLTP